MHSCDYSYNGCIEVWRYIWTILVGLLHFFRVFYPDVQLFSGCYVAVDFFFMLSGYYMFSSLIKNSRFMAWNYVVRKYKSLSLIYVSSIVIWNLASFRDGPISFFNKMICSIPDTLCLQMSGIFYPNSNGVVWYISAMLIASYVLISLFRYSREWSVNIIFPLFIVLGYSYIFIGAGNLDVSTVMNGRNLITPGVIRALSGMSIGVGVYLIENQLDICKIHSRITAGLFELCIILLSFSLLFQSHSESDFLQLIFFPILISLNLRQYSPWSKYMNTLGNELILLFGKDYTLILYCYSMIIPFVMSLFISFDAMSPLMGVCAYLGVWFASAWVISRIIRGLKNYNQKI